MPGGAPRAHEFLPVRSSTSQNLSDLLYKSGSQGKTHPRWLEDLFASQPNRLSKGCSDVPHHKLGCWV